MTHSWDSWSDARAYDGAATILQPQALPRYNAVIPNTLLALFSEPSQSTTHDLVQATWQTQMGKDFEQTWHDALASGVIANTAGPKADVSLHPDAARQSPPKPPDDHLTLLFRPDPHLWDGRYANNPWLQELPRPLTKLTWDNPLLIAPERARALQLRNGDMVRLAVGDTNLTVPVWIMPGQAEDCVVALLGFGEQHAGTVGTGAGLDLYPLTGRADAPVPGHMD